MFGKLDDLRSEAARLEELEDVRPLKAHEDERLRSIYSQVRELERGSKDSCSR